MATIKAPNKEYNGTGPGDAVFNNGVAKTDDEAAINYYRSAGYEVDGSTDNPVELPTVPDPREHTEEAIGTRLRDAAVDPRPGDFLAPINAGEANPHGPEVVSPEIHASGPAGILPGVVAVEDPAKQEKRESDYAEVRLIQQEKAAEAIEKFDEDDRGELGLSDPGSGPVGREAAEESDVPSAVVDPEVEKPAASAKKAEWVAYATTQGMSEEEAQGLTAAKLAKHFG